METTTRFKICCIQSVEEAALAVSHGAAAVGLVSDMPSGPGVITEEKIAEIAASLPPAVASFLLTCKLDPAEIAAQQRRCGANTIQLCDRPQAGSYGELRMAMPGVKLVQVIHVTGGEALDEALAVAPEVDALLLDSGDPRKPVKELGGTGRVHDWNISRRICDAVEIPVFLAGGLTPDNVARAVCAVRPFAVDVCSGVRGGGRLDDSKLRVFVRRLLESRARQ